MPLDVVVRRDHSPLLGRHWLRERNQPGKRWLIQSHKTVHSVSSNESSVEQLCKKFTELFEPGLGCLNNFEVNITVKPDVVLLYKKACTAVPYHLRPLVDAELN